MWLIENYWFITIIMIFWKWLQGFSLLILLRLSRIQKTVLTNLKWQLVITSLNLNHAAANSAHNFSKLDRFNSTLLNYLFNVKIANIQIYLNYFSLVYLLEMICELKFSCKLNFNILDLSLNSFIGILFIIIGLIVRVELKFFIQKDLKWYLLSSFLVR